MNWYVAKLVFRVISGDGDHQAQFDEQLRLISAETELNAFEKANKIGHANQDSFKNIERQTVKWQFIDVAELNPISEPTDGTELYYNIHETPDADLYIAWAHHKAALLGVRN
ncbi:MULTISPECIES: DUF4288 domain-containing protein [unclassified Mucilaginibacter]|jgi:hypothetical protein|uniref:DUF4288 domain-containing protein n=1 Tax=unclassified Mucilaginibacter TaxID=2617802 RepID=UPI0008BBB213|nr:MULTISPECIES: DUF4288 domain-containing protein [unclassified Mucilaginibacter]WDF76041.1 DUF4288 domain-containing protein [Mucilaginibacter sp. KACC 22773]SEO59495.1 protein of unknown function [Mucilaginibacter sp. OK283]